MPRAEFIGIVVAAGRSTRFGGSTPKQFLDLSGASVLERGVAVLAERAAVVGVVVVLPAAEQNGREATRLRARPEIVDVVPGGATRAASVAAGLAAAGECEFVLVHDAARPLARSRLVEAVIEATRRHGAAIPGLAVSDTVKRVAAGPQETLWVAETVDRAELRLAQTPQGARTDWLREALDEATRQGIEPTDEAAALEQAGRRVAVVAGDPHNRKITSRTDLDQARRSLDGAAPLVRVGSGFDVHRFGEGRRLMLGGVLFEGERGLVGHSDADVVLHAAMDAVLGAAGLADIGALFPPDDARFERADSSDLARQVAGLIAEHGFEIVNLDITVLAERPKIRPRAEQMRAAIARALRLAPERIGLKATTLESLGALGRGEGIACQSVALIRRASAR